MQVSDRIGRRIKLQDLNILIAVVQAGSMGKAARELNTSQPNISKSIADLEYALGVRLLDRNPQGVEPTEYGRALLDGGAAVFDELRQTVKNIEFLADPTAGEVRIGSTVPIAASFVSAVVERIVQQCPRIVFHFETAQTDVLHRALQERKVDLLVARRLGSSTEEQQTFQHLFEDSHIIAAGAKNLWSSRRRVALTELMGEPWVLPPPESPPGSIAMEAFRACGFEYPHVTVFAISPEVRLSMLQAGRFLTIFPTSELRFPVRSDEVKVLPIELELARVPIGIITLKHRTISPAAKLFVEQALEIAKSRINRKPDRQVR